jgi:hypothetical protein
MTLNSTGLGIGDPPNRNLDVRKDQSAATIARVQNQSVNAAAYSELNLAAYGNNWGIRTGSTAANSNRLEFVVDPSVTNLTVMALDSSGNVGIGVTPSAWAAGYKAIQISSSQSAALMGSGNQTELTTNAFYDGAWKYQGAGTVAASRYSQQSGVHYWFNAAAGAANATITDFATAKMTLDASGNLLVGTTSSSETSDVGHKINTSATAPWLATVGSVSTNSNVTSSVYSTGAAAYRFYVGFGGTVFATNTTISAISDARFKENVQDIDVGLAAILSLKPRKFDWKAGKGKDIKGDRGFIAQEFETVFPNLIDEWKDPAPEGEAPYKSVRQDLIPVLVKAIQELTARVQTLEAR